MENFLWLKILCSCIMHFSFCYKASISAVDPVGVHLNISEPFLDVKVNDIIYIECSGSPPLRWEYESPTNSGGNFSKKVFSSKNESIIRLKFNAEDATGRQRCRNNYSEASVYIFVNGNKLMLTDPDMWISSESDYIRCVPTASGVNMSLQLNSELVPSQFDPTRGFLLQTKLDYGETGFECLAEYGDYKESELVIVDRLKETTAIPLVLIDNANATYVTVGSNFSLICSVRTDVHAYLYVTWSCPVHDTERIKEKEDFTQDDTYLIVNKTLRILKATESDSGSYRCKAKDSSSKENFAEITVQVYATPPPTVLTFLGGTEEAFANKNEKIELIALYKIFPPASNIPTKWSKDDQPIVSNFKHTPRHTNFSLSLEISDLNGHDSGLYTVTVNASGSVSKKSFFLRVKDQPFVNIRPAPSCCFYPGKEYNFSCQVQAYPKANISWSWKSYESSTWTTFEKYYEVNNSTVTTVTNRRGSVSYLSLVGQESGFYKCKAENEMGATQAQKLFVVSDAEKGFEIIYSKESTEFSALCKASSVLYSDLRWKRISVLTNESKTISTAKSDLSKTPLSLQAELKEISESENETYVCSATLRKSGEVEHKLLTLPTQDPLGVAKQGEIGSRMKMELLLIPVLGILLTLIITVCLIKIYMSKKRKKTDLQNFNHPFLEGKLSLFNSNLPLDEQVDLLPYDETWEFPRENLKLGRTLGQGAFGRVVKAEAFEISEDGTSTTVAVKILKEKNDRNQQKALMDELKILIHLGHHVNIVNLMGAVTKNIQKDGLMVIVEYCRYGNIRHYLQRCRDKFVNEIDMQSGKMISSGDFSFTDHDSNSELIQNSSSSSSGVFSVHNPNYRRVRGKSTICTDPRGSDFGSFSTSSGSVFRSYSRSDSGDDVVTTSDLLCFAFQCSRGMDYLASKKLIHRDLAARNVLLSEGKIVKICDFGLAKDCYKYSNYIKKGDGPLPIKWMSIESIWDHVFTTKSDVWSFGILMWELFTLGGNPYPGLEIDENFYKKLKSGYRMEKPELCPVFAYEIMRDCWNADPDKRPHFSQVSEMLGNSLDESIKQHYIDVNEPYMEMNRKMKSPFYSNVERLEGEEPASPYVNSNFVDIAPQYDVPRPRSILDEPMEVVPMIQLSSTLSGDNRTSCDA